MTLSGFLRTESLRGHVSYLALFPGVFVKPTNPNYATGCEWDPGSGGSNPAGLRGGNSGNQLPSTTTLSARGIPRA